MKRFKVTSKESQKHLYDELDLYKSQNDSYLYSDYESIHK